MFVHKSEVVVSPDGLYLIIKDPPIIQGPLDPPEAGLCQDGPEIDLILILELEGQMVHVGVRHTLGLFSGGEFKIVYIDATEDDWLFHLDEEGNLEATNFYAFPEVNDGKTYTALWFEVQDLFYNGLRLKPIFKELDDIKEDNKILQELLDHPDAIGPKYEWSKVEKLLG